MSETNAELRGEDWQRQGDFVHELLRPHPLLQPLRDAREPVCLSCHTRAIWAHAIPLGAGEYAITSRIEQPERWIPLKTDVAVS